MGSKSKSKISVEVGPLDGPIVDVMTRKYGDKSLKYLNVWTAEFGFPIGGSLSLKNISILEEKLKGKEQEMRRKKRVSVQKFEMIEGQKECLQMWKGEAETRNQKTMQKLPFSCEKVETNEKQNSHTQRTPDLQISSSLFPQLAALKLDPDLNGNPPFRPSFNTYSGLQLPDESSDSPDVWEIHLCNCFLNRLKPDIASAVKSSCIVWNDARLSELRRQAIHAHDQILSKMKKKETTQKKLYMAAITMYNTVREHGQPGHEHRGKERGQHRNLERKPPSDVCFLCGQRGHWRRDCHRNTSSNLSTQVGLKMPGGCRREMDSC
ncbi:hypothetical protein ABVT39_027392 [Epinephelus coioides]